MIWESYQYLQLLIKDFHCTENLSWAAILANFKQSITEELFKILITFFTK